jgi:hypothetical protein
MQRGKILPPLLAALVLFVLVLPGLYPQAPQRRGIVLVRGNAWTLGVPGFGSNAFRALSGDYRLVGAGPAPAFFSVHVTGEPLYFSPAWRRRSGRGGLEVFERSGEDGFFAAALLEGEGTLWTAVFHFPGGLDGTGLNEAALLQLLGAWSERFLHFFFQAKTPGDLSLPATLYF